MNPSMRGQSQLIDDPNSSTQKGYPSFLKTIFGGRMVRGESHIRISTKLPFQANFQLVCCSAGLQILCISPLCVFKARKEGRARIFYKEWKHINDSCGQLLIFLTYNFLITVNQNSLHDNILEPLLLPWYFRALALGLLDQKWGGGFNSFLWVDSGLTGCWRAGPHHNHLQHNGQKNLALQKNKQFWKELGAFSLAWIQGGNCDFCETCINLHVSCQGFKIRQHAWMPWKWVCHPDLESF